MGRSHGGGRPSGPVESDSFPTPRTPLEPQADDDPRPARADGGVTSSLSSARSVPGPLGAPPASLDPIRPFVGAAGLGTIAPPCWPAAIDFQGGRASRRRPATAVGRHPNAIRPLKGVIGGDPNWPTSARSGGRRIMPPSVVVPPPRQDGHDRLGSRRRQMQA
ncbi:MAG: hypothetical protein M1826_000555 [Phylliscum demangeonii]|nr:MAG: hypothetical protein M1826_000555 [Phylliscum demangeonii]